MEWTDGGTASHFSKDGSVNRRTELNEILSTVEINGAESRLKHLSISSPSAAKAYALFEEREGGRKWAAVVLSKVTEGNRIGYAILPEWTNPPYYNCSKRIMQGLTPLDPGEGGGAKEWRQRCWEEIRRKKDPLSFESLPAGTQVLWTVCSDDWPFLAKGSKVKLVKEMAGRSFVWKDPATGIIYDREQVPKSDYKVLSR